MKIETREQAYHNAGGQQWVEEEVEVTLTDLEAAVLLGNDPEVTRTVTRFRKLLKRIS